MRQHTQFHQESATDTKSSEMVIMRLFLLSHVQKRLLASANIALFEDITKQKSKKHYFLLLYHFLGGTGKATNPCNI